MRRGRPPSLQWYRMKKVFLSYRGYGRFGYSRVIYKQLHMRQPDWQRFKDVHDEDTVSVAIPADLATGRGDARYPYFRLLECLTAASQGSEKWEPGSVAGARGPALARSPAHPSKTQWQSGIETRPRFRSLASVPHCQRSADRDQRLSVFSMAQQLIRLRLGNLLAVNPCNCWSHPATASSAPV